MRCSDYGGYRRNPSPDETLAEALEIIKIGYLSEDEVENWLKIINAQKEVCDLPRDSSISKTISRRIKEMNSSNELRTMAIALAEEENLLQDIEDELDEFDFDKLITIVEGYEIGDSEIIFSLKIPIKSRGVADRGRLLYIRRVFLRALTIAFGWDIIPDMGDVRILPDGLLFDFVAEVDYAHNFY
jgi:hypothetical protein